MPEEVGAVLRLGSCGLAMRNDSGLSRQHRRFRSSTHSHLLRPVASGEGLVPRRVLLRDGVPVLGLPRVQNVHGQKVHVLAVRREGGAPHAEVEVRGRDAGEGNVVFAVGREELEAGVEEDPRGVSFKDLWLCKCIYHPGRVGGEDDLP